MPAYVGVVSESHDEAAEYASLGNAPSEMHTNVGNQMYSMNETMQLLPEFGPRCSSQV